MTKEELKAKFNELVDSLDEYELDNICWQDEYKDEIIFSLGRELDTISHRALLEEYNFIIDNIIDRFERVHTWTIDETKKILHEIHWFYVNLRDRANICASYKMIHEGDRCYIEYRGERGEVLDDDPGQQMVLRYRGEEHGTGSYNFCWEEDMCAIIDAALLEDKIKELERVELSKSAEIISGKEIRDYPPVCSEKILRRISDGKEFFLAYSRRGCDYYLVDKESYERYNDFFYADMISTDSVSCDDRYMVVGEVNFTTVFGN